MPNYVFIRDISRSWLYFISEALEARNVELLLDPLAIRTNRGELPDSHLGYVVAGPALEWRISPVQPDTLEISFRLYVVTTQQPGDILENYERNLAIQLTIQEILFNDELRVAGYSTGSPGSGGSYAIPLRTFSLEGEPETVTDTFGLQYNTDVHWINQTENEKNTQVWTLDISITLAI